MSVEAQENQVKQTPADRILSGCKSFVADQPLVAGIAAGILFGGLANSGLVFFAMVLVVCFIGMHWHARHND